MPADTEKSSILVTLEAAGYHAFAAALRAADLVEALLPPKRFTVFAPNDAAFSKSPLGPLKNKRGPLRELMSNHIAVGEVHIARFAGKRIRAVTLAGGSVVINAKSGLRVDEANIVEPDLHAANGVIHGIDRILWPIEATSTKAAPTSA